MIKKYIIMLFITFLLISLYSLGAKYIDINESIDSDSIIFSSNSNNNNFSNNEILVINPPKPIIPLNTPNPIGHVDKKIFNKERGIWHDSINTFIGDTLNFRIEIIYRPTCGYLVKNISVIDRLPLCFELVSDSIYIKFGDDIYNGISGILDNKIFWNLSADYNVILYKELFDPRIPPDRVFIYYNATVVAGCGDCNIINKVNVTGIESCCGQPVFGYDEVNICIECPEPDITVEKTVSKDNGNTWHPYIPTAITDCENIKWNITVRNTGLIAFPRFRNRRKRYTHIQ